MRKYRERPWLKYVVATCVLGAITTFVAWTRGVFSEKLPRMILLELSDSFFLTGFVAFFQILRAAVMKGGFLDKIAELFGKFIQLFKQDRVDRKYRNFGNYKKALKEKKKSYAYLLILGFLFIVIGIVLGIAFWVV